ncbi:MAG TPA: hypothetical protein VFK97_02315 [Candidatus Saccharimonadales bacterium]|nr:hypothetical protein [Candidatus Saccharimonadales bacterium]
MKLSDSGGFSIIELILAIVVGVTFISSMNLVVDDYTDLGKRDRNLLLANSFAEAEVEQLRNNTYNSLNLGTTSLTSQMPSQLPSASGSMTVSQAQTGLKQIDISISFNDLGATRTYTYRTYEGELGVGQ